MNMPDYPVPRHIANAVDDLCDGRLASADDMREIEKEAAPPYLQQKQGDRIMRLYELPPAFAQVEEQLAECDGEIPDEIAQHLDQLNATLEDKVASICAMVKQNMAECLGIKAESGRLIRMLVTREKRIDWLKGYLKTCLQAMGIDKVQAGVHGCRIQKNSTPSVSVTCNPETLPERFRVTFTEPLAKAIADEWKKTGQAPEGVKVEVGTHLRIL